MASGNAGLGCGTSPSGLRSALVKTATTPGAEAASDVSMSMMRAWACGDRTYTTHAAPASSMSST